MTEFYGAAALAVEKADVVAALAKLQIDPFWEPDGLDDFGFDGRPKDHDLQQWRGLVLRTAALVDKGKVSPRMARVLLGHEYATADELCDVATVVFQNGEVLCNQLLESLYGRLEYRWWESRTVVEVLERTGDLLGR